VWGELPSSDPEGRIDVASLIARARSEPDVIALSPGSHVIHQHAVRRSNEPISGVYSSTDPASLINFLRSQNSIQVIETEQQVRVLRREAH
jgi:hypothetical protein